MTDWTQYSDENIAQSLNGKTRMALQFAADSNPDQEAEAAKLARRYNLPADMVGFYADEYKKQAKIEDSEEVLARSPRLKAWLAADDARAKVTHDDLPNLSAIEQSVSMIGKAGRSIASGVPMASAGLYGAAAAPFELVGMDGIGGWLREQQKASRRAAAAWQGADPDAGFVERSVMSGFQSAGQNLAMLPVGFANSARLTGEQAMLGLMGLITGGQSYGKARDQGLAPAQSIVYGVQDAAAEIVTEKYLGMAGFIKNVKAGASVGKLFGYEVLKEVPGEIGATLWQNFNEWGNLNPDKPIADWIAEQPEAIAQTIIATLVGGTTQIGAVKGVEKIGQRFADRAQQAQQAELTAEQFAKLNELATASKVLGRDGDTFEQFVAQAAEDGPAQDVYISASALMQSGLAEQLAQASPAVAEQLQTALETGGDVRIPVAEYASKIAANEAAPALLDHLKFDPQGFTKAEAADYLQNHATELQAEVDRTLTEQQNHDAFKASQNAVKELVLGELNALGRFTPAKNELDATLIAARTAVRAAQLGITPEAMFQKQLLKLQAEGLQDSAGNATLNQGGALSDVKQQWTDAGIDGALSERDGTITLSKIVVPETDRATGKGTAAMQALIDYADRTGQHVVLSPSTDFGGNKKRLTAFYKRFGFVENKGKNRAFSTSESMYRQASGKVLYQSEKQQAQVAQQVGKDFLAMVKELGKGAFQYPDLVLDKDLAKVLASTGEPGFAVRLLDKGETKRSAAAETFEITAADGNKGYVYRFGKDVQIDVSELEAGAGRGSAIYQSVANWSKANGYVFEGDSAGITLPGILRRTENMISTIARHRDSYHVRPHPDQVRPENNKQAKALGLIGVKWATGEHEQNLGELLMASYNAVKALAPEIENVAANEFGEFEDLKSLDFNNPDAALLRNPELQKIADAITARFERFRKEGQEGRISPYGVSTVARGIVVGSLVRRATDGTGAGVRPGADALKERLYQPAYHGSPYKFDKFSLDHLGKGEGAQAYGWGLYFAGKKEVAEYYRGALSDINLLVDGQEYDNDNPAHRAASEKYQAEKNDWPLQDVIARIKRSIEDLDSRGKQWANEEAAMQRQTVELLESGAALPKYEEVIAGQLYKVEIPEDDTFLLWDKPLSEQSEKVRAALSLPESEGLEVFESARGFGVRNAKTGEVVADNFADRDTAERLAQRSHSDAWMNQSGEQYYQNLIKLDGSPEAASKALNELGIAGVKYLDGTSRAAGEGDYNYVIFDENAVHIAETYYQNQQAPRGAFDPASNTIALLKNADLSTFLHEAGHFFFENDIALAGELASEARNFGMESLKPGERQILADVSALLTWHGIPGDLDAQLAQWQNLPFEEKRSYHERTAESFEAYLLEGKAPSIELQRLFQTFRAWLLNVYRSLKDFVASHPESGQLNDEVRGVFDRMLATSEQIQLAEQGRSMMPLFNSAKEAGMTPEEFAAYQALGVDSTNEAIQDLQARGLRDLQWLKNAHGKEVKKLQKLAAARRAEVQIEVRREVISQPVYRAWQFLTGKIGADDKITPVERPKSDPDVVDPAYDTLLAAIAKLGGLNKHWVTKTWGTDPADKPQSGVFGKPVWRLDGGLSIDGMAEALGQYGYLSKDENGRVDLAEFERLFDASVRGEDQYSNNVDGAYLAGLRPGDQVANLGGLTAGRLDRGALAELGLPGEIADHVVNLKMTAKDGLHPDIVAELFGFSSGDELVRTLAAAEAPKAVIDAMTDQRMLEQYGDLSSQAAIERAADKAIHNDARARMVAAEANALAQATGQRKVLASAAKEYAAAMIARLKVRDLRPNQYASAEVRASKAAEKASKAGDLATAAAEKRNQFINTYATRAAYEAQEEVETLSRQWRALANRSDDKLRKAYDMDLINAVRAILGEYGIAEKKAKRAGEYLNTVASNDPEMFAVIQPAIAAAEAAAKPFKEMTVEEVRGLAAEIDGILHLARRSRQMEIDGDLIDRQEVEAALRQRMEEIGIPDRKPGEGSAVTEGEQRMMKFRTAIAALRRVESWVGQMDGPQTLGPFRRFVWGRIKDGATAYRADKAKALREFRRLFDAVAKDMKPQLIAAPELGYTFGKSSGGSAMNEILHAILHTGNRSNQRKLLLGRGWAAESADGVLDTRRWDAFLARMIAEGKLNQAHFDFAQGVWDLLESMKPAAQKTHRDVFGKYFDEVTADEFKTPFGTYRGGYVPAMADPLAVTDAKLRALANAENDNLAYAFPATNKGFTKSRVDYNRPLLLDLRTLTGHIDKVLLFSHLEMPVRDVKRVVDAVSGTLDRLDSGAIGGLLTPWLNRAAKQQVVTPISDDAGLSRFLVGLRSRAGMAAMFGNLANAAQQITGFSLAALKVPPKLMLSATADWMKSPRAFANAVAEASPFMADRMENEVAAMNGEISDILLNPSLIAKGRDWTMRHAYFLQSAVDNVMSPIIWTAAYNQAIEQGLEHADAVKLGDSAVRETQGSTLPEDISRIESGNAFVRLFTQFAGYFNMQANLLGTEFAKVGNEIGLKKGAGRGLYILAFGFLAPAIVGEAIIQAFRGGPDDEDKDGSYLDDWLAALFGWAPVRTLTAMVPVAGSAVNAAANAWNSKPYDDRMATSPAISMLESAAKAPVSAYKAIVENGSAQKAVRDVATVISLSVGVPASAAARPIGYLTGVAEGRTEPTSGADFARGVVQGSASPESKR